MSITGTHSAAASIVFPTMLLVAASLGVAFQAGLLARAPSDAALFQPASITIQPRTFEYRADGEYLKGNQVVDAPMIKVAETAPLVVMKYQVTLGEYNACVADGACRQPDAAFSSETNVPATGVNFDDARTYADWLSKKTGEVWTLPTDLQLAFAAGPDFPDDALGLNADTKNPAIRWLADYKREAAEKAVRNPKPQVIGSFGVNQYGLADFAGNVWEWTTTCHRRVHLDARGSVQTVEPVCGVYLAVGNHRSPMTFFVRNPKGGGCSVGTPPSNLGFRLVRDDRWYAGLLKKLHLGI